ncbi:MAG: ATP-binding protein [Deltaproteobacteria bacterium]|nr:ATP-binding protein [Deltaproteobacteria bacterium]
MLEHKSVFLFGPRQTGKTTFLAKRYPKARTFNLLEADVFRDLSANPEYMRQRIRPLDRIVVIDEVQKLPALLDEVQLILDRDKNIRFILTGSSARKLKRGGVNLLAGRAWTCHMHPLVSVEVGPGRLLHRINRGGLPPMLDSPLPHEELKAYVGTYLQEEIRAEGLTRSIENFSRFLTVAGLSNGQLVNFTKAGNDAQVPPRTVREYYQVLEDTLILHQLSPFQKTKKRKPVATSKYYFFDVGVANHLMNRREILPGSPEFGPTLEHLVFLEIKAYLDYERLDIPLTFWRSQTKLEVDFLVGDGVAIEVKGTRQVSEADLKGLKTLAEERELKRKIVVGGEAAFRKTNDGIEIWPVEPFLEALWAGEFKQNLTHP